MQALQSQAPAHAYARGKWLLASPAQPKTGKAEQCVPTTLLKNT